MTARTNPVLGGLVGAAVVATVCLVAAPPLPLAIALAVGATALLAQVCLGRHREAEPIVRDPVEALLHEVERSRRYGRHCSLALMPGGAEVAVDVTRRTDESWDIGGDLLVLMPETTRASAQLAVTRLIGEDAAALVAVATFPDDALTVHGLLDVMQSGAPASDAPAPEATPGEVPADVGDVALGLEVG